MVGSSIQRRRIASGIAVLLLSLITGPVVADDGVRSPQEEWVWERIRTGQPADLDAFDGCPAPGDPLRAEDWPRCRSLRSSAVKAMIAAISRSQDPLSIGVRIKGARFEGPFDLMGAGPIRGGLELISCRFDDSVLLLNERFGSSVLFDHTVFAGFVSFNSAVFEDSLFLRWTRFLPSSDDALELRFMTVGGNLDLRGATLRSVDLRGTNIHGELRIEDSEWASSWQPRSELDLRHAKARMFHVETQAPRNLVSVLLGGFEYDIVGGFDSRHKRGSSALPSARFLGYWLDDLKTEKHHSMQPHAQLGKVLRRMGFQELAEKTLVSGKRHELEERRMAGKSGEAFVLMMEDALIGFGYKPERSAFWAAALVLIGTLVARSSGAKVGSRRIGFWYSLDLLLPIVQLRKLHYETDLPGWQREYFYFHTLMGYLLATFLIAGASGLVH